MIKASAGIAFPAIVLAAVAWAGCGFHMINDVTTDTENPPEFVSAIPHRQDTPGKGVYGGPEAARKQRAAYPDIRTLAVGLPPSRAYDAAVGAAKRMNWRVVEGDRTRGRIEAVAATRWFGFEDDVVIRIAPAADGGSVIDIRSASRVGKSDFGTNARRIRSFQKTFEDAAKEVR
jgi:hypothetical protein